jgi:hypothetical protein
MKTRIHVLAAALIGLLPGRPPADVSLPLIEYRVLAGIGQVRLSGSFVHDPATQGAMLDSLAVFDQRGLILVAGESVREFKRRETIGSHVVETTIHVYPATGRGFGGGLATADIVVLVDGNKRIDCPYVHPPVELADVAVLPVDGMISVSGSYNGKSAGGLVFLNEGRTIDLQWLQGTAKGTAK